MQRSVPNLKILVKNDQMQRYPLRTGPPPPYLKIIRISKNVQMQRYTFRTCCPLISRFW